MTPIVEILNVILGTGGVIMLVAAAVLFVDIVIFGRSYFEEYILPWGLLLASVLLVSSMVMALVYSEHFGFVPCGLCWTMRIFVFSQAIMLPIAAFRRDTGIALYGLVLSALGAIVGLYQHYLQMGGSELINCPAAAGDCAKRILFEYGFMTFPLMGASMLLLLMAIYIYLLRAGKSKTLPTETESPAAPTTPAL